MPAAHRRKEPFDGLRGLAALGVAAGSWGVYSIWADVDFVRNLSLLADFVLVIAGFIVSRAHRDQLVSSRRVGRFIFARTGRLLPLHVACLAVFLSIDALVSLAHGDYRAGAVGDYLATLFLVQIFVTETQIWNAPAWIVAVELHFSYLFALLSMGGVMTGKRGRGSLVAVLTLMMLTRYAFAGELSALPDLLMRGAIAFMTGALLYGIVANNNVTRVIRRAKKQSGAAVELWALSAVIAFLIFAPPSWAAFAPLVFGYCLLIFVRKFCSTAEVLTTPPLQRLGDLSYSILLTHSLLIHPIAGLTALLGSVAPAVVTVLLPAYLLALIALSEVMFRAVEAPTRRAMWAWADHAFPKAEQQARAFAEQGLRRRLAGALRRGRPVASRSADAQGRAARDRRRA